MNLDCNAPRCGNNPWLNGRCYSCRYEKDCDLCMVCQYPLPPGDKRLCRPCQGEAQYMAHLALRRRLARQLAETEAALAAADK